jgi:hypothetical protein
MGAATDCWLSLDSLIAHATQCRVTIRLTISHFSHVIKHDIPPRIPYLCYTTNFSILQYLEI